VGSILAFSPLLVAGVFDDFLDVLHNASYGSQYNRVNRSFFFMGLDAQYRSARWLLFADVLLAAVGTPSTRRLARTWALCLLGVLLYKPLSPVAHGYLSHPATLILAINIALLVGWLSTRTHRFAPLRLLSIVAILVAIGPGIPSKTSAKRSLQALGLLARGNEPVDAPMGCERYISSHDAKSHYKWQDYLGVLDYLRHHVGSKTRVANVLCTFPFPPINGPAGRITALPAAGGIVYLIQVDRGLEHRFVQALEETPDAVVVWAPDESSYSAAFKFDQLTDAVEQLYEREARFGIIEVWRKKPANAIPHPPTQTGSDQVFKMSGRK
jgi:hypothetical protein